MIATLLTIFSLFSGRPPDHHATENMSHTVVIERLVNDSWQLIGTGVAIKTPPTWDNSIVMDREKIGILTAAHIMTDLRFADLRACNIMKDSCVPLENFTSVADEDIIPNEIDWAFVFTELPNDVSPTKVRWETPEMGETLVHVGFPFGDPWVSVGNVSIVYRNVIVGNINIAPGSSGGGVFDAKGRLVGIVVAYDVQEDRKLLLETSTYWRAIIVPVRNIL